MHRTRLISTLLVVAAVLSIASFAPASGIAQIQAAPDRPPGEGEGPFDRLILRGATLIDGTGAPPFGPVDIVVEGGRIVNIVSVGAPGAPIAPA